MKDNGYCSSVNHYDMMMMSAYGICSDSFSKVEKEVTTVTALGPHFHDENKENFDVYSSDIENTDMRVLLKFPYSKKINNATNKQTVIHTYIHTYIRKLFINTLY